MRYPHHDVGRLPRCIACYFSTESLRCGNQHGLDCAPSTFPISACIGKSASTLGKRWCWHMDLMRSPILSAGFQPLKVVQGICRCTFQDSPVSKSKTMYHRCSLDRCEVEHRVLEDPYPNLGGACRAGGAHKRASIDAFHRKKWSFEPRECQKTRAFLRASQQVILVSLLLCATYNCRFNRNRKKREGGVGRTPFSWAETRFGSRDALK